MLFGTLLEQTGATAYVINFARRLFRNSSGGPAKVAVVSSGLMGSLSGSAVANTATTGTFTIPLMRSSGFRAASAAGVEAAASSGGALMPPIMGAGAYMMLELVTPAVTYIDIIKAAAIPALLYYTALLLAVHFHSCRIGAVTEAEAQAAGEKDDSPGQLALHPYQGVVFFGSFVILIIMLLIGFTPFRSVSVSLIGILVLSAFSKHTRVGPVKILTAMTNAARGGVSLIVAAGCVGIILGLVNQTGLGAQLPDKIQALAGNNELLALFTLMVSTIILGMGLPSAVCYLLMAILIGSVLSRMETAPLAAHLFIFYFGMMSMVTPPVALAAYTAAAIAKADIMKSALAAFRFALVGFALPYAFVLRPQLLMLTPDNEPAGVVAVLVHLGVTLVGIFGLAAGMTGFAFKRISLPLQVVLVAVSLVTFFTRLEGVQLYAQLGAIATVITLLTINFAQSKKRAAGRSRQLWTASIHASR